MGREKAPPAASDPKITEKTARNRPETALEPIPINQLSESTKFNYGRLPELPDYHLLLDLRSKPFEPIATGLSILQTFLLFFTQAIVDIIVVATNAYTARARH